MSTNYVSYAQIPWYRRSGLVGAITFLGLFFTPAVIFSCVVVLTGDVFYDKVDDQGQLVRWSFGNKIAAVIILVVNIALMVAMYSGAFKSR